MALCHWVKKFVMNIPVLEDDATTVSRNVGHQSLSDLVTHRRRMETFTAPLLKPKMSQNPVFVSNACHCVYF